MHRTLPWLALLVPALAAAVPMQLTHQGRLLDDAGDPLTGDHTLVFSLYSDASGGSAAWSEELSVSFDGGYYSVLLGTDEGNPLDADLFGEGPLFLGLEVDGSELSGRTPVASVPWAVRAQSAATAATATDVSGGVVDATELRVDGQLIADTSGLVVSWDDLPDVPDDLADGDDDSLAALGCADGQAPVWDDGAGWTCGTLEGEDPVAAMGAKADDNPLHHDRYSDQEVLDALATTVEPVGIGVTAPMAALDVDGGIKVGADATCDSDHAGLIAFDESTGQLTFCNGTTPIAVATTVPRTCKELKEARPAAASGVYSIDPDGAGGLSAFETYCEMDAAGGGWTLLAKTVVSGLTSEERDAIRKGTWADYAEDGYGSPSTGSRIFWLPLDRWHELTSEFPTNQWRVHDSRYDLRMEDLLIGSSGQMYRIDWGATVSGYDDVVDGGIKGMKFTTWDRDNDVWSANCAKDNVGYNGAWWYTNCYQDSMLHSDGTLYSWVTNVQYSVSWLYVWFREA